MSISLRDSRLQNLVEQMTAGNQKISQTGVSELIDAAYADDGRLSGAEKSSLRHLLTDYADMIESPEARGKLADFNRMSNATLRDATRRFAADGNISSGEARELETLAMKDGRISKREKVTLKALMGFYSPEMEPGAREFVAEMAGVTAPTEPTPGPTPSGPSIDLGLPSVAGQTFSLSPAGHLSADGAAPTYDDTGALNMYRGAQALAQAGGTPFADVSTEVKASTLDHLKKGFEAGQEDASLPKEARQQMRSGAATTLLSLIEGCGPDDAAIKEDAVNTFLAQAKEEPLHGIRASMFFNMERIESQLNPAQKADLAELKASVAPSSPPYEKWFADGKREINVKHYAHHECWIHGGDPIRDYERKGFKVISSNENAKPPTWTLERTNEDAPGGPVKMKVDIIQSHDGIFTSMDEPDTNVIVYTGHSNLGGNVSEELRLGSEEKGDKLVMLAMCRGKQNMFEVANKYPNAHFVTTDKPSYFSSVMPMSIGMLDGAINLKGYEDMKGDTPRIFDSGGKDNYFYPHEPRRYAHYDADKDGRIDERGAHVDRLFDISLKAPQTARLDGVVRPNDLVAADLDGTNVLHATQFLNTLMTYHVEKGHHTSALGPKDVDNFVSDGWFEGPADQKVRLTETPDGKVKVQVNKGLADQSGFVLGAIVQHEVVKEMLTRRNGGELAPADEARAALFAGEYLAYMYCSWNEAQAAIKAIGNDATHLRGLTFDRVQGALDADGHGYVTDKQVEGLVGPL